MSATAAILLGVLSVHPAGQSSAAASIEGRNGAVLIGSPTAAVIRTNRETFILQSGRTRMACDSIYRTLLATIGAGCRPANPKTAANAIAD